MKKILAFITCLILLLAFAGCGKKEPSKTESASSATQEPESSSAAEIDYNNAYKAPAELFKIDLTAKDPSNENILFTYNSLGQVETCVYKYNDQTITLVYSYSEAEAGIYGFIEGNLIYDQKIELTSPFNPDGPFSEKNGIYFKGF